MMLSCKVSLAMHNAFRANMGLDFPPFPKLSYASMLTYTMYWVLPPSS